jgi:hypothetical protein
MPSTFWRSMARTFLRGPPDGIFVAEFEKGEIGPDLFMAACNMGLGGMGSKRASIGPLFTLHD